MAFFHERGFWSHHVAVAIAAIVIVTVARSIGLGGDPAVLATLLLQSSILVLIALPVQVLSALLGAHTLAPAHGLRLASLAGCVLGAIPASVASTLLIWFSGFAATNAFDVHDLSLMQWMIAAYVPITLLHATLGSLLWMTLGLAWWRTRFDGVSAPPDTLAEVLGFAQCKGPAVAVLSPGPAFMRRLAPDKTGQLFALSAERHYVRVYTATGEALLLMRLSDAIDDCRHLDGMQIHRSCWVHRDAVEQLRRTNGKLEVRLKNGISLPVSRSRQSIAGAFFRNGRRPTH